MNFKNPLILIITFAFLFFPTIIRAEPQNKAELNRKTAPASNQVNIQVQKAELITDTQDPNTVTSNQDNKPNQRSQVAQEVEKLLASPRLEKGVGQEVKEIAQAQKEVQTKIEENLSKLDLRRGWIKKIIGPDYKAIKDLQKELNQNQLRIQQLGQLQNKLTNQADKTMIQETIQVLNQENTSLQEKISSEEKITNLFGWLFKRFIN